MTTQPTQSSKPAAWTANDLAADPHGAADKADRVQRMFAAIAGSYDLNNRLHSFFQDQRWRRKAVALVGIAPGDRVLDVACGTGDLSEAFARAGALVTGVDFTEPMLEIARRKVARRSDLDRRPDYRQGDAMNLAFPDRSFDVVSIAFGLRNVAEPARALREFHRVLRPGGRLVVLEFSEPRQPIVAALNRIYSGRVMPLTATLLARDRSGAYRYLPRSVQTFASAEALAAMVREAGFEVRRQKAMTFGVCTATVAIAR
ncbi:MAG: bifunctional demethylmenaquinone methyltransferase/2-methoxy-6-polyprenyl-1,4-benzoquinol methylase UbiE [Phycisphaerales bacterium]|nr:bifunctional demethylmenaquinone methyltransferase/2-methoxy-6-polyprenyl-1,4-benzoquinol methylase UbiE [Phycisphaerales bacterium]